MIKLLHMMTVTLVALQRQKKMHAVSLHVNESDETVSQNQMSQKVECPGCQCPNLMQFRHALPASKRTQVT